MTKLDRPFTPTTRPKWTSSDMGEAMLCAVRQHAAKVQKGRGGSIDCNAWWRGGDDLNVRIYPTKGTAHDIKEGKTYNAKDFANVALGMSLPKMMEAYGPVHIPQGKPSPSPILAAYGIQDERAEEQRPAPAVVAAAWKALEAQAAAYAAALWSGKVDDNAAARWLATRNIPARYIVSGFAVLDRRAVAALADARAIEWLRSHVDSAIVAPLRSARSGVVASLQARAFAPVDERKKRRTVGPLKDEDGTPRVFGDPARARSAAVVVLVEGMADTWAAEALGAGGCDVAVIGAASASALPDVARWLFSETTARVVIVRHLDGMASDGVGQTAAGQAAAILGSRGQPFAWPKFRRALLALGVDTRPTPPGFDLAAATALAKGMFDDVADAFLTTIGVVSPTVKLVESETDGPGIATAVVEIWDRKYGAPNDDE